MVVLKYLQNLDELALQLKQPVLLLFYHYLFNTFCAHKVRLATQYTITDDARYLVKMVCFQVLRLTLKKFVIKDLLRLPTVSKNSSFDIIQLFNSKLVIILYSRSIVNIASGQWLMQCQGQESFP